MALRGQRFELDLDLDLDVDEFTAKPLTAELTNASDSPSLIGEIRERDPSTAPAAPKPKASRTGFPEHRKRTAISSAFKQQKTRQHESTPSWSQPPAKSSSPYPTPHTQPSDQAMAHQLGRQHGYEFEAQEKARISEENKGRMAAMSDDEIEEARAELMANLNPALIEKLLKRATIDDDSTETSQLRESRARGDDHGGGTDATEGQERHHTPDTAHSGTEEWEHNPHPDLSHELSAAASIHFPVPPRPASSFVPLDPNSAAFLSDLKTHYFPDTPHDPSSLSWLQDPSPQENDESPYNPTRDHYSTAELRFDFKGIIIPPAKSLAIPVDKGLHHHGMAPSSAGYTIPELAILSRSTLPNQRCIAYQAVGRILFRLGRGDFGPRGSELQEGLWSVVEKERVVEVMMSEANRTSGHTSAKAYATEALWLWRRGGGGDRGRLKETEKIAK